MFRDGFDMGDYPKRFAYKDMQLLTDDFDVRNFIGRTQLCKVNRGKIPQGWNEMQEQDVTLKVWVDTLKMKGEETHPATADNVFRFYKIFLDITTSSKPIIGVPLPFWGANQGNTQLARLLEFLHGQTPQYLVRNISAAHIMVDQDLNPVLFEFGMLTGGKIGKKNEGLFLLPLGAYGYTDTLVKLSGIWTDRTDVFSLGIVLLELLCKCDVDGLEYQENSKIVYFLDELAEAISIAEKTRSGFEKSRIPDLDHVSFAAETGFDAGDGLELAKLAIRCVQMEDERPAMGEVVNRLKALHAVRSYAELLLLSGFLKTIDSTAAQECEITSYVV
ncbi:hypothetical protein Vadar_015061 [Vaccinium darrowii]|uniref:Uncharacterized protein n=1 Tax=Vaccinium darrowii TaxID=229202 RepID=A0ACB7Y746_9ERIC|nr:hypothetical protein Vadar_015061 [Vaccinium darrowii]